MRKPMLNMSRYVSQHLERENMLTTYSASKRGRDVANSEVAITLKERSAMSLYATNTRARIAFAGAAAREIARLAGRKSAEGGTEFWFLTFAPIQYAVPMPEAAAFDHEAAKTWAREILGDLDYVAVLEAAYYSNFNPVPATKGPCLSWHFHVLTWGATKSEIDGLVAEINSRYRALLPGAGAAHWRQLSPLQTIGSTLYMLKAPMSEYRVYPLKIEEMDSETGEFIKRSSGGFNQKKRPLRPGDALKLCRILGSRTLPMLTFSHGDGDRILRTITDRAQRLIAKQDDAHRRRMARLLG